MKEIEKIIERYQSTNWEKEKSALGTVVRVEESAYRRVGARIYVSSNGDWTGGISGGCLEGDALKRAQMAIARNKSSIVVYDTLEDDAHQIGVGLGCNGRIDVLITPIDSKDPKNPVEQLKRIVDIRKPGVLLQVLQSSNSDSDLPGQVYLEEEWQNFSKKIGLDAELLVSIGTEVLERKKSKIVNITSKSSEVLELLFEFIRPRMRVVCVGDNYDVNALVSIAHELGWEIHVAGKLRKLSQHVFDHAKSVNELDAVKQIALDANTAVILMSHDYKTDLSQIQYFLQTEVPYLGVLGPKKRMQKMKVDLEKAGYKGDLEKRINLHAPIGLDLGAESPEEIALSIVSEIVSVMRGREGGSLKFREGPIYER